jgi:type VI secretion system protein VasG
MTHVLQKERSDIALTADHFKPRPRQAADGPRRRDRRLAPNQTEMPGISDHVQDALDGGWYYATLLFGETQIRTGYLLVGALKKGDLGAR